MNRLVLAAATIAALASTANAQAATNVFDRTSGANTYYTNLNFESLSDGNWVVASGSLLPNSGADFISSDNGNFNHDFEDIGLSKKLGGVIQNHPYAVSFFIALNFDLQPVEFADFSSLRIGGLAGTMLWTSTPTPAINGQWYEWTGTYTPTAADLGTPFYLQAVLDLDARHSLAIDGPIPVPIPEPTASLLTLIGLCCWAFGKK